MTEPIDISRNNETGEIEQFTVLRNGQPRLVKATPENLLLYDPADELPFDGGMHEFLSGNEALILSEDTPELMIAPTSNEYCYILRVNGSTVETTPSQAERVLRAIKDATIDKDFDGLIGLYDTIRSQQVRRDVITALMGTFDQSERIEEIGRGWLIDSFYLVNWEASMYAMTDDPNEADVKRDHNGVREVDNSYEFVELRIRRDIDPISVGISGESYRLSEREMLFLAKVRWLLDRRHYHPDTEFWKNADQHAAVDWRSGEPLDSDGDESSEESEPDLDSFDL